MARARSDPAIPLPTAWPEHARAAVLHVIALAHLALTHARGWCAGSRLARVRLAAERDVARSQAAQARGEARILRARLAAMDPRRRPHHPPPERLAILTLRARAGLHLAPATVARLAKRAPRPQPSPPQRRGRRTPQAADTPARRVTARHPHHLWHVDLTLLPTVRGWWVPWLPFTFLQRWPFCFWLAVVLDHHSRSVVAWRLFPAQPRAEAITDLLDAACESAGTAPKHILSDRGPQFRDEYRAWCDRCGVRPRFGALGRHGSIALIERFLRSLKHEMLRRLPVVPLAMGAMGAEVHAYVTWYHDHRPHRALRGATPAEVRDGRAPARDRPRLETRPRYPLGHDRTRRVTHLTLVRNRVRGRDHLPVVAIREAA